jgi:hypothetical protein
MNDYIMPLSEDVVVSIGDDEPIIVTEESVALKLIPSPGRKVAILSGVVLDAYIFPTIHRTETEIASFERGGLLLSNDTNFNFIPSLVNDLLA